MSDDHELRVKYERAFAKQSQSDWQVYKILTQQAGLPECHALHYLQMATEKLAKAYRVRATDSPVTNLVRHHTGFVKFVRQYLLSPQSKSRYAGKAAQLESVVSAASKFAAQIERLAPAVDPKTENAEYPWESGSAVVAPCEWQFSGVAFLREARGRQFLKTIELALGDIVCQAGV